MNTRCISCNGSIPHAFSWTSLLTFSIFRTHQLLPLHRWLCSFCQEKMEMLIVPDSHPCVRCSRALIALDEEYIHLHDGQPICADCKRWLEWEEHRGVGRVLSQNISAIGYNEWAQEMIGTYKFKRDERLKYFFASLLVEQWQHISRKSFISDTGHPPITQTPSAQPPIDWITAIPLSPQRLTERGFNQSELVARLVAKELNIPYMDQLLTRENDQGKQSKRGREERLQEMLQKFIKNSERLADIRDKNIIIIDDIYTTGATMYAAAYTLKDMGAKHIFSLTIAR